jgi:hypothetical protein
MLYRHYRRDGMPIKNIVDRGGDHLLVLKGNQKNSRNRYEVCQHLTLDASDLEIDTSAWSNLNIIGMVESQRTIKDESSVEYRYYIGSMEKYFEFFAQSVRAHWGVENCGDGEPHLDFH